MKTKTTTETREAVSKLIVDCLITGDAERTAEKVEYGNPDYWTDQIMQLIAKEKQDLLQEIMDNNFDQDFKTYDFEGIAIAVSEKLAEMSKEGKGEK